MEKPSITRTCEVYVNDTSQSIDVSTESVEALKTSISTVIALPHEDETIVIHFEDKLGNKVQIVTEANLKDIAESKDNIKLWLSFNVQEDEDQDTDEDTDEDDVELNNEETTDTTDDDEEEASGPIPFPTEYSLNTRKYGLKEVTPFLVQGRDITAERISFLLSCGVTHVVNATDGVVPSYFRDQLAYLDLPVEDRKFVKISEYFNETCRFIDGARKEGGVTLVHCRGGVSRSSALVLAYLMYSYKQPLDLCYAFLTERNERCLPNIGFMEQLVAYEIRMFGKASMKQAGDEGRKNNNKKGRNDKRNNNRRRKKKSSHKRGPHWAD